MPIASGTCNGATALLNAIQAHAVANGWTSNQHANDGNGKRTHLSKNGCFVNLRSLVNEAYEGSGATQTNALMLYGSTGYNAGNNYANQPGRLISGSVRPAQGVVDLDGATMQYYLYAFNGSGYDVFYGFINHTGNQWQHFGFGNGLKIDSVNFTGGAFTFGSSHESLNNPATPGALIGRCNTGWGQGAWETGYSDLYVSTFNGFTGFAKADGFANTPWFIDTFTLFADTYAMGPNPLNGGVPIDEVIVAVSLNGNTFDSNETPFAPVIRLPNIGMMNIKNYDPASTITITPDTWRLFPMREKNVTDIFGNFNGNTGWLGIAVKEI